MAKTGNKAGTRGSRKRRGAAEDVTGKKAGQVEVRTALSQGDLKLPAVDDYNHHKKNIAGCLDSLESAKSRYRKALQSAQAAGIDTDAMLEARRIVRANDPKKTASRLNQLAFALEQEGFSIHITVHDTLAGDEMDTVYRRFYADGKAAKTLDCRYPAGSDLAAQAARAWRHGTSSNLGLTPEQSDAAVEDAEDAQHQLPPPPDMAASAPTTH